MLKLLSEKLLDKIIPVLSFIITKYIDPFMTLSKEQKDYLLKYKSIEIFPGEYTDDIDNILVILKNTDNINDFIINIFSCSSGCLCKYEIENMDINSNYISKIKNPKDHMNTKKFKIKLFDKHIQTCLIHTIITLNKLDSTMKSIIEHIFDVKFEYILPTEYVPSYNTDSDMEYTIETYDDQCYNCELGVCSHDPYICNNYVVTRIPKNLDDKMSHKIMCMIDTFFDNE